LSTLRAETETRSRSWISHFPSRRSRRTSSRRAACRPGLNSFPDELDREIARTKLATLGIELDEESDAQRRFATEWSA